MYTAHADFLLLLFNVGHKLKLLQPIPMSVYLPRMRDVAWCRGSSNGVAACMLARLCALIG